MPRNPAVNRRGRRPSLRVAARHTQKIQKELQGLVRELAELEARLLRLEELLEASRRSEEEKRRQQRRQGGSPGIRGQGPNIRDIAHQILARRKRPLGIQELAELVLAQKPGKAGDNFTQNLGAALARDSRFKRVGRGTYTVKR